MKRSLTAITILMMVLLNIPGYAQDTPPREVIQKDKEVISEKEIREDEEREPTASVPSLPKEEPEDETHKGIIRYSILIGSPIITIVYGANAWGWGKNHSWQWGSERWFKRSTDSGGADKIGHGFAHYAIQRISYNVFDYTENGRPNKWTYSLLTSVTMGTLIEVGDAFSGHYGFSYEDLIIDYVGIALGALLDYSPVLDSFFGFSFEYWPSEGLRKDPNKGYLDAASDYSGYKVMMNFKLAGFHYLGWDVPEFFRYLMFDVGYYTRGYTSQDRYIGETDKKRYWFVGISINFMEVVKDFFEDKESTLCWLSQQPFNYYHVPVGYKYEKCIDE